MPHVQFKSKVIDYGGHKYITVPKIERKHCDMAYFRQHKHLGGYANSDMFHAIMARCIKSGLMCLESLPSYWKVDTSKFLADVSIDCTNFTVRGHYETN